LRYLALLLDPLLKKSGVQAVFGMIWLVPPGGAVQLIKKVLPSLLLDWIAIPHPATDAR
jgi:hypothetical protein